MELFTQVKSLVRHLVGGCFAAQAELVCLCVCVCSHTYGLYVARESVARLSGGNGPLSCSEVLSCFCECWVDEHLAASDVMSCC